MEASRGQQDALESTWVKLESRLSALRDSLATRVDQVAIAAAENQGAARAEFDRNFKAIAGDLTDLRDDTQSRADSLASQMDHLAQQQGQVAEQIDALSRGQHARTDEAYARIDQAMAALEAAEATLAGVQQELALQKATQERRSWKGRLTHLAVTMKRAWAYLVARRWMATK
jgi:chromosome segregation ATPase